jgi:hypothetical protein
MYVFTVKNKTLYKWRRILLILFWNSNALYFGMEQHLLCNRGATRAGWTLDISLLLEWRLFMLWTVGPIMLWNCDAFCYGTWYEYICLESGSFRPITEKYSAPEMETLQSTHFALDRTHSFLDWGSFCSEWNPLVSGLRLILFWMEPISFWIEAHFALKWNPLVSGLGLILLWNGTH